MSLPANVEITNFHGLYLASPKVLQDLHLLQNFVLSVMRNHFIYISKRNSTIFSK